jgi:hypothetical protein
VLQISSPGATTSSTSSTQPLPSSSIPLSGISKGRAKLENSERRSSQFELPTAMVLRMTAGKCRPEVPLLPAAATTMTFRLTAKSMASAMTWMAAMSSTVRVARSMPQLMLMTWAPIVAA